MAAVGDALLSLGRVAGNAAALGVERLRPARSAELPFDLSRLSAKWLTRALSVRAPGTVVRSFELLDQHSGTTSRARLRLDYSSRGEGKALPDALFLKIAPASAAQRLFVTLFGLGRREADFYRTLSGSLPVRSPEVYAVECGPGGRRFAMLLEDLGGGEVSFANVGDHVDLSTAGLAIDQLARLHAAFWDSPRFCSDLAWLPTLESRQREMPLHRFVTGAMIGRAVTQYAGELPPEFRRIASLCTGQRDGLEALWARGTQTLVHGDCHVGNLFFEGDRVGFLDWQVCGRLPGIRDVSYFLTNSCPAALRAEHERALIERYLAALKAEGVEAPGFDVAWRDHRLHVAYTWLSAAVTAAAGAALQSREIAMAGLTRSTRAVIELDTISLIEAELAGL